MSAFTGSPRSPGGSRSVRLSALLLFMITITLLGGAGLAVPAAAAEPLTVPVSGETPENFESSCFADGGQPFEINDSNGGVATSVCQYSNGSFNECNWGAGTCTYGGGTRVQPPPRGPLDDVTVDPDDFAGVLDESPSQPAATEPPAEETDEPATEPATEAIEETDETDESAAEQTPLTNPAGSTGSTGGAGGTGGNTESDESGQSASAQGPASLTIVAFTCEPGYDPFALDADPAQDCSELTDGVPFAL
ncbi:MAG TPA: hypothetical protein VGR08_14335, partial [Thermomicrobiales bacterium]|nr:hypothetical protein [Thermomicrobiales bacterium]